MNTQDRIARAIVVQYDLQQLAADESLRAFIVEHSEYPEVVFDALKDGISAMLHIRWLLKEKGDSGKEKGR